MTKIIFRQYKCPKCKENYTAQVCVSWYSALPKPKDFGKPPTCPKCGTPHKSKKREKEKCKK